MVKHGKKHFVGAALLGLAGLVVGCSSTSPSSSPSPTASVPAVGIGRPGASTVDSKVLPPPPESSMAGRARVVNLYVDDGGAKLDIDVWAQRTFTEGEVLLAKGVKFGAASDYFVTPKSHSIVFTKAGASVDDAEVASMFNPAKGEQITAMLLWENGKASAPNVWEIDPTGSHDAPAPPSAGEGLVVVRANQLTAFEKKLTPTFGGRSFDVGDGKGACVPQARMTAKGATPAVLGGTQPTLHDLLPGPAAFTLHKWPDNKKCATDPVFTFSVDVSAGETTAVFVYTPDGTSITTLALPVA